MEQYIVVTSYLGGKIKIYINKIDSVWKIDKKTDYLGGYYNCQLYINSIPYAVRETYEEINDLMMTAQHGID